MLLWTISPRKSRIQPARFSITVTFNRHANTGPVIAAHWSSDVGPNRVGPMNAFLNWWDGNELWLSGLAFVLQAMIVMPVVLAVAYVTAALLDGLLGKGIKVMRRAHHAGETPG
jgi:hypothetical protein